MYVYLYTSGRIDDGENLKRCRFSFAERITWSEPLRGNIPLTDKEIVDNLAIGGWRNAVESVARLHLVKQFGIKLGGALRNMLRDNTAEHARFGTPSKSWVNTTCDAIGSDDPDSGPPPSAVAAVGPLLEEWIGMVRSEDERQNQCRTRRTNVDAHLLEAWRAASPDPDSQIYLWLTDGSPTGITSPLIDPGIFPEVSRPADMQPQDLHCDEQQFQNYPAVEEQAITDTELTSHLDKGHIVAFDTYAELQEFLEEEVPVISQVRVLTK